MMDKIEEYFNDYKVLEKINKYCFIQREVLYFFLELTKIDRLSETTAFKEFLICY
jgi:hypothetical protein